MAGRVSGYPAVSKEFFDKTHVDNGLRLKNREFIVQRGRKRIHAHSGQVALQYSSRIFAMPEHDLFTCEVDGNLSQLAGDIVNFNVFAVTLGQLGEQG